MLTEERKNVNKKYEKSNFAIKDISFSVPEGSIVGFIGENGAGKSTTMKMILSLLEPTSGEIDIFGNPVEKNTEYLNHIGSMIEEPSYYPNLSGYENLLVFQKMIGFDKKNIWPTLELVGLAEKKNRRKLVKAYSLGMKQRLALAFALVKDPKILLLDEPTNGLDPAGIHEIRELIIRLAKEKGLTVFISSHILSEIEHIADRVGIINRGRLVYEGKIEKIKSNAWLEIEGDFFSDTKLKEVLEGTGVTDISDKILKFKNMDNEETSKIIRQLVIAGYPIYRVERKKESLEDIFLSMTKED